MADCTKCANRNNDYCIFACENGESFKPITNADRIRRAKTEEELMECIFHALKMSRQYNDSRIGMVEWLKGEQWSYPIIPTDKEGAE